MVRAQWTQERIVGVKVKDRLRGRLIEQELKLDHAGFLCHCIDFGFYSEMGRYYRNVGIRNVIIWLIF